LELPTDLFLKSVKIHSFLGFALLFEEPCPLSLRMAFLISSPDFPFVTAGEMFPGIAKESEANTDDFISAQIA